MEEKTKKTAYPWRRRGARFSGSGIPNGPAGGRGNCSEIPTGSKAEQYAHGRARAKERPPDVSGLVVRGGGYQLSHMSSSKEVIELWGEWE